MNTTTTVASPPAPGPRPKPGPFNPKRNKPRDFGTDRSSAYNKIHNTEIANNYMLDRFLKNREDMQRLGMKFND